MPYTLEPGEERRYSLIRHKDVPVLSRPAFVCAAATGRLQRKHASKVQAYDEVEQAYLNCSGSPNEQIAARLARRQALVDIAKIGVIGSVNIDVDGRPAQDLDEAFDELDDAGLYEVAMYWPNAFRLTEDDRKNSQSPSPSDAENSAGNASAENATTSSTTTVPSGTSESPAPLVETPTPNG